MKSSIFSLGDLILVWFQKLVETYSNPVQIQHLNFCEFLSLIRGGLPGIT
jgi:hypothetical protein